MRPDLLCTAEQAEENAEQVVQPLAAVRPQRVVVDDHDHHRARHRRRRVPHVDGVGDVDLEPTVVEEAGAVGERKARAEARGSVLHLVMSR